MTMAESEELGAEKQGRRDSGGLVRCTCAVEKVNDVGEVLNRRSCKSAVLELGRNEVNDVVLKVFYPGCSPLGPYTVREHSIHRRFLKEGKASILLKKQKLRFLISNCPPDHLRTFLQTLSIKLAARGKLQGSHRRMLGDVSAKFNEISPLNEKDVEKAKKSVLNEAVVTATPTCFGKENSTTPHRVKVDNRRARKRKLAEVVGTSATVSNPTKKPALLKRAVSLPVLTSEQSKVLEMVKNGESVFFTGSAGTGKSYLLRRIISALPPETTFPTASTGAAACLIGGTTLHSFAGIGSGSASLERCVSMASREPHLSTWRKCRCLVIDEISMVDADLFDKIEGVARAVRRNREPFGGIQLVLCGDFLQLPPVSKASDRKRHCFQARSWKRCITRSEELTQVHRQKDKQFIALLQNVRIGRCPEAISSLLTSTQHQDIERDGLKATKLCTHKEDVEAINDRELDVLGGREEKFEAQDSNPQASTTLDTLCPVGRLVVLKVGAQVMLTKNIDVHRGLVNGARGVIKRFEGQKRIPVVWFASRQEEMIGMERWTVRCGGGVTATRRQLPLKLAWAISVHKSQGMTLDCVEMSLSRCFEAGQAYVALSRAKSLLSLRVRDFHPSCIRADSDALEFYRALRRTRRNYIEDGYA